MDCVYLLSLMSLAVSFVAVDAGTHQILSCPLQSLYQFGASKHDPGNSIRILPGGPFSPAAHWPYGVTFPGKPTGRWSDGRLMIDFAAMAFGLPLLNPYLDTNASFDNGVNFAVAGSTALNASFFADRNITLSPSVTPLHSQLIWFRTYLATICSTPTECVDKLKRTLFFMGEIGSNDINYSLSQGKSLEEIQTYVPFINQAIINATIEIIEAGAMQIVVPGNFPMGCFPFFLSALATNDSTRYDKFGCLRSLNSLVINQNLNLQRALDSLRMEFPNVVIIYGDYYNAFRSVLRAVPSLGFDRENLLNACLIGNAPLCPQPDRYLHWDGIHLTQEANRYISEILIEDIRSRIKCFHKFDL